MPTKKTPPRPALLNHQIPAGRLLELQSETVIPEPYVVTDSITITPPTKARADKIREAQMTVLVYNTLLNEAMRQTGTTEELITGLTKHIDEAEQNYNESLLGDQYEAVTALLGTLDDQLVQAFQKDLVKRFFPNQPVDGKCEHCGQVIDAEAEGKALASSP